MMRRRLPLLSIVSSAALILAALAIPFAVSADPGNGIAVTRPQIYDFRELEIMLRAAEERLAQIQAIDGTTVAGAVGRTQGVEVRSTSFGLTASSAPIPGVTTQETLTRASDGTTSGQTVTTTTEGAVTASPAAPPTPPAALGAAGTVSLSARDLLAEQVGLTYQIANLRLLLQHAVSERIDATAQGSMWREPVLLGFDIHLDPPRYARNAVAEVIVTVAADREAASCGGAVAPRPAMNVVALFPAKDSYNVSTVTKKASEAKLGANVGVVTLGVGFGSSRETLFLVRDIDTLAFEQPVADASGSVRFGWRFQPVLGSRVVEPGQRQVFALLSTPDFANEKAREMTIGVETRWRAREGRKRANRVLAPEPVPGSTGPTVEHFLTLLPEATFARALEPKFDVVRVSEAGGGQILIDVEGHGYSPGMQLLHQRRLLGETDGLRISGDGRLRFLVSADALARGERVWVLGRHGELKELQKPSVERVMTETSAATASIESVRRVGESEAELVFRIAGRLNPSDTYLLEIGGRVDRHVDVARSAAASAGDPLLRLRVPIARLFEDHEATLFVPFSSDARDRIVAPLPPHDIFRATRLEKLADLGDEVQFALHGQNLGERLRIGLGATFAPCHDLGCAGDASRRIIRLPKKPLQAVDHLVLTQGTEVQTLATVPARPPTPSGLSLVGALRRHDSREIELRGQNLASVAEVRFESSVLALRREGERLLITIPRAVTEKAGDLQLSIVDKNGASHMVPFAVADR
jgi:hypothetical protein